eukprot:scaffold798_cov367-Pavlova_lutheri.AAC.12
METRLFSSSLDTCPWRWVSPSRSNRTALQSRKNHTGLSHRDERKGRILRDLGPGIPLWEFLLYWEKKLYRAGRQGRRSRTDRLVPGSR